MSVKLTKRSKRKARAFPVGEKPKMLAGATKGTFKIVGDIVGPIVEWDEERSLRNLAELVEGSAPRAKSRRDGKR